MDHTEFMSEEKDFSVVLGGPFYQLMRKTHLAGRALELVKRRVLVISLFTWLPLLVFSLAGGQALPGSSKLPFLLDFDIHLRFLLALPLLIIAEFTVHSRILKVHQQFEVRRLISESSMDQFGKAIASSLKMRNSIGAEVVMVLLIYSIGYQVVWVEAAGIDTTAWYTSTTEAGGISLAGMWFRYLSLPVWQFMLIRWYYRIFIWARFLFLVSRIKLNLRSTHPDNAGGLGFLENSVHAFKPIAMAHGVMLAGMITNHIVYGGATLLEFKIQIALIAIWVVLVAVLPLVVFAGQLADAQRQGGSEFGILASRFTAEFESKWMRDRLPENHSELGEDIQSLSDLSNSYSVVTRMKVVPISRNAVISLAIFTLAPLAPLILTLMPLGDVLKMIVGVLF
jgi:hypothetical protein